MLFFLNAANYDINVKHKTSFVGAVIMPEDLFSSFEQRIIDVMVEFNKNPFIVAKWNKISPSYAPLYKNLLKEFLETPNISFCGTFGNFQSQTDFAATTAKLISDNCADDNCNIFMPVTFTILEGLQEELTAQLNNIQANKVIQTAAIELKESKTLQLSDVLAGLFHFATDPNAYAVKAGSPGKADVVDFFLNYEKPANKILV